MAGTLLVQGEFLKFLGPFSKEFGHGSNCGDEFWSLCSSSSFSMQHPMLRLAMLAANFTAPTAKVSNGIARLIVPADFNKLKAKKQQVLMDEVEQALYLGWVKVGSEMPQLKSCEGFRHPRHPLHLAFARQGDPQLQHRLPWHMGFFLCMVFGF